MNPIFKHDAYTLHVMEENSSFVNVGLPTEPNELAHDQDFGINQTLIYSLLGVENFTSIDSDSGAIFISKPLDREQKANYSFQIKAVQSDSDQRFAISKVNLIVDDINDNHAVFDTTIIHVTIQENLAKGSIVQVVQASDADVDTNGKFSYVISDGALMVDPITGKVSVLNSSALDRENNDILTFQISTIPDSPVISNSPCPKCNVTLNVTLIDVNDNSPKFVYSPYVFTVEKNVPDERVGQVLATDADKDENALVRYSIASPETTAFSVNDSSGEVTLLRPTTLPTIILVKACDSPIIISLSRCSIVQVNVQAKDNVTTPGYDIVATVTENLPVGTFVAELGFYSNQLQFKLQENNEFILINNIIKTKVGLDREKKQSYSLQLSVLNGSQIQSSYFVNITVLDVNDNVPEFSQSNYVFSLTEDMKIGSEIGKVEAMDMDDGINAIVTYDLVGKNSNYFSITPTDGRITLKMMPDIGLTQQFLPLLVRAADSGEPSLQNVVNVQIHVGLSNGTIRIQVGAEKNTIIEDQKNYESSLTDILGVNTVIANASTYGVGSLIYISATNITDGSEVPLNDLTRLVESNMANIQELFKRKLQSVSPTNNNGMSTEAIALIAVACVLFVGSIFLTAVTYYKYKRYQRLQRLVHNLSRKNSIYETQETSIAIEEEVSDYDGQDSISTQNLIPDHKTAPDVPNGHAIGVVNPGFVTDDTEEQNNTQNTEPESDYINAGLDQPTTSSDTSDSISEHSVEKDYDVPVTDDANCESTKDLFNKEESIEDPENDDAFNHEEITNATDEDSSLKDGGESERFFVPVPPPLPDIMPSLSKSSSSSELTDAKLKGPVEASKTPHYENVLSELSAAVKKRSAGLDDVEDEPEIDPKSKDVPKVHDDNLTDSLEVIDLDEADPEDLNTSSNLNDLEEPEPDYAKRVRFNEGDVKDETKVQKSDDSDDEQPNLGHDLRNSEEIKSPVDSLNGESGTFLFGETEITEF